MPRITLTLMLSTAPLLASCDRQPTQPSDLAGTAGAPASTSVGTPETLFAPHFNPDSFVRKVDNRFFPLVPGTRFVYVGQEDGEKETNVTVVTTERPIRGGIDPMHKLIDRRVGDNTKGVFDRSKSRLAPAAKKKTP